MPWTVRIIEFAPYVRTESRNLVQGAASSFEFRPDKNCIENSQIIYNTNLFSQRRLILVQIFDTTGAAKKIGKENIQQYNTSQGRKKTNTSFILNI